MHGYPKTVEEILEPAMRFRRATLRAVKRLKAARPWRGSLAKRKRKFRRLHRRLCRIYGKQTRLTFGLLDGGSSGGSSYCPSGDAIRLVGKLSVVTYLHEFAHALGRDERGACRWSVNLFRRCFPRQFRRCKTLGHMVIAPQRAHRSLPGRFAASGRPVSRPAPRFSILGHPGDPG